MFKLIKIENGRLNVPEPIVYEASVAVSEGEALALASGRLAKCGTTTKPEYIAMGNATAGEKVAVCRVESNQVYEAPISAAPGELAVGSKVKLDANAAGVTADTASGVATIVNLNGAKAAGDTVIVRF